MHHHPLTLTLLLTSLTLTTSTPTPATNTTIAAAASASASASASAAATSLSPPPSPSSLTALALPGGTANPALTLLMYSDPSCTYINDTANTLINALPLSYNVSSPQIPFWGFMMTRNLTANEVLTFYSSTNTSRDACGVEIGKVVGKDDLGEAGWCLPAAGASCYELRQG